MNAIAKDPAVQPPAVLMTLRTYRRGVDGEVVDESPRREITSAQNPAPLLSSQWPLCECPRCTDRR
ncbi:hypothetical protein PV318_03355 [Streptomyces sp. ME02-6991-2B]|nr:hypothetical protein [Streptomyces sp. ME02-6991-2B]